jgi:hypothetical protein
MASFKTFLFATLLLLPGCGDGATPGNAASDTTIVRDETAPVANDALPPVDQAAPTPTAAANGDDVAVATAAKDAGATLPADVVTFRAKRDECDHFRGEEPTDAARAAFLEKALERTCQGTDAALKALRKRHAENPAAIAALASYEDDIE